LQAMDTSKQWIPPSNGHLQAMDTSKQWTPPSNGYLQAMDTSKSFNSSSLCPTLVGVIDFV
ncbi:MAG: hypothetical protein PHW84_03350, partial [Methanosarcina sp.]|nr:hypothetical protein [Methanosarcina sp.]